MSLSSKSKGGILEYPQTIKYPKAFESSLPAGYNGIFDWSFLLPIFQGTKIEPMDIDGLVERYGRILIFETKQPDKDIPSGQVRALEALLRLGRGFVCIMVLYGKSATTIAEMEEWHYRKGRIRKSARKTCDSLYVKERVTSWFKWANRGR